MRTGGSQRRMRRSIRSQGIRLVWLRRKSARCQSRLLGFETDAARGRSWSRRNSDCAPQLRIAATGLLRRWDGACVAGVRPSARSASLASRLRIVCRSTVNCPLLLFFPQMRVKPRKLNVSGLPSPRCFRFLTANGPNSSKHVFSGCSAEIASIELPCLVICPSRRRFPLDSSNGISPR
jgi:hypothetical protein